MKAFLVVAAGFCLNAFTFAPMRSYGPFFVTFERDLNASAGQASLTVSLMFGSLFLSGPLASVAVNRFGYRAAIIFGISLSSVGAIVCSFARSMIVVEICSAIIGVGCGFTTLPSFALLGNRFKENRSFANNVMSTGGALLAVPLPPLVQYWIYEYSWRGATLLLAGLFLNGLPSGLLLTVEIKKVEITSQKRALLDFHILKSISFCAYVVSNGLNVAAIMCVYIYLVRFAQSRGVDDYLAASLTSILAFVELGFRPISGYVTSLSRIGPIPINRIYVFSGILFLQALVLASYTLSWSYEPLLVITIVYAILSGCRGELAITLIADLFGTEKLVSALGWRHFVLGVFSVVVPPLVGSIVDATGYYAVPFFAGALLQLLAVILVLVAHATISWRKVSNEVERDDKNVPIPTVAAGNE